MIKGMTGFGAAQISTGQVKGIVEIKTVNHRYFDASYYLPIGFGSLENKIQQILSKEIKRGRVTVSVKITQKPGNMVSLNEHAVENYIKFSKTLKRKFKLDDDLTTTRLFQLPGVVDTKELFVEPKDLWPALEKGIKTSLRGVVVMRRKEGRSLKADISDKLKRMGAQVRKIQSRTKAILTDKKKTMSNEEFCSYRKGIDIAEELTRMTHYLNEVARLLKSKEPMGKKIDFIAQEMQRETNTMGSKLQDKVVTNAVIAMKSKIEKIREQAQNIE